MRSLACRVVGNGGGGGKGGSVMVGPRDKDGRPSPGPTHSGGPEPRNLSLAPDGAVSKNLIPLPLCLQPHTKLCSLVSSSIYLRLAPKEKKGHDDMSLGLL